MSAEAVGSFLALLESQENLPGELDLRMRKVTAVATMNRCTPPGRISVPASSLRQKV